ncbi:MAG: hypothetical protein KDC44_09310 [Phaeodactylibacter sp.]|nr:hypothetical protein [Phaeodactylibacter sp.]
MNYSKFLVVLASFLFFLFLPMQLSQAGSKAEVELPIAELEGLIQQLEDVGAELVGEAGAQMRDVIREASEQARQRIDQIKDASIEVIQEARAEFEALKDSMVDDIKELLNIANDMLEHNIKCIDEALAKRIAQVSSEISYLLDKTDLVLQKAIDRVYIKASLLIDQGSERVALVASSTLILVARIIAGVLAVIILFWLIRTVYLNKFPNSLALKIIMPTLLVGLAGLCVFLVINKTVLPRVLGATVDLPNPDYYCEEGDELYDAFFDAYNAGDAEYRRIGEEALTALSWCAIGSVSTDVAGAKERKQKEIAAILYPVPDVPEPGNIDFADCEDEDTPSVHPGWLVADLDDRLKLYENIYKDKRIPKDKWVVDPAPAKYKTNLKNYMKTEQIRPVEVQKNPQLEFEVVRPDLKNVEIITRETGNLQFRQ